MTEYHAHRDDDTVTDVAATHGIVSEELFGEDAEIDWETGVNPQILRDVADLIEFCYPDESDALDIGLVSSQYAPDRNPPAVVVGRADDDRYIMAAPRLDCRAGPYDDEQTMLTEGDDA